MVDLETKYGRRYECRGIVAFLQREGLESGATKGGRSFNSFIKTA